MLNDVVEKGRRIFDTEIEQLKKLRDSIDEQFRKAVEIILKCEGKVVVTGVGKSGHVARKIASTFASTGTPSFFLHPAEALHGDLGMVDSKDVVLAISNSGQSPEILGIIPYLKFLGVPIISITNNPNSELAKVSDVHLNLCVEKEACPLELAPTSSSTSALVLGDALAMVLLELRGFGVEDFAKRHPGGLLGRKLRKVSELCHVGEEVPLVEEEEPMTNVVLEMTKKGFGCAIVVDKENRLKGIITDGDLRRFINRGGDIKKSLALHVMTKNPKKAYYHELAAQALKRMEDYKITVLPVVNDDDRVVGVIHMHDILRAGIV